MSRSLRSLRIAIGVADPSFRDALRRTLEREGATVVAGDTAAGLIDALPGLNPDACIIDVDLPDLGPAEIALRIRKQHTALPIVLVSAHLFPLDNAALKELQMLPLPFSRRQLIAVLDRALGGLAA